MTLPYSNRRMEPVTAVAGQTDFAFAWRLLDVDDLEVWRQRAGVAVRLVYALDWALAPGSLGDEDGGTVVLLVGATAGDVITILGVRKPERLSSLVNSRAMTAGDLNAEYDALQMQIQELRRDFDRALRLGALDIAGRSGALPTPIGNAVLGWNSAGTGLENKTGLGSGGVPEHGELVGLGDDDHPHYHNDARGDARYVQIGAFAEAVDDRVGALLVAGTNITLTYNDGANTLTIAAAGGGGGVTDHGALTGLGDDDHPHYHNDARGDARYVQVSAFAESVDDRVAALLVAGTNITLTYNDGANTLTIAAAGGGAWEWIELNANVTLASNTSFQRIFQDGSANGYGIPCVAGRRYEFELLLQLTGMSATSGNLKFGLSDLHDSFDSGDGLIIVTGFDATTPTTAAAFGGSAHRDVNQTVGNIVTAATGTAVSVLIKGQFYCTTGGDFCPSVALTTAAAATVQRGAFAKIRELGAVNISDDIHKSTGWAVT